MKKVCVDQGRCIGCGACVAIAPENFDFNDDGLSVVINEKPTEEAQNALEACPVFAIAIEDNEENKKDSDEVTTSNANNCDDSCNCSNECNCEEDHCGCHECHCCQDNEDKMDEEAK